MTTVPSNAISSSELQELLHSLSAEDLAALDSLLFAEKWLPLPGPQTQALESLADVLLYGGAAGGGKTDLEIGAATTQHTRSIIYRREGPQLQAIIDRTAEIVGHRIGLNEQRGIWRIPESGGKQLEFGSCPHPGDETRYQGRPHDLVCFDEIPHFLESQFRFLMGWTRTSRPGQRTRVIACGNPPTDSDGLWILDYWAPWLQRSHPNPAKPGELRWFVRLPGEAFDREVDSGTPFTHNGKLITPLSRTFIPSRVTDNPFLLGTNYEATLQALPEPLRSQMLEGDYTAGLQDDKWQVIPTAWVEAAQARWKPRDSRGRMDSVGVDVARGGRDSSVISRRHGTWFDELIRMPGKEAPDGPTVAGQVVTAVRDGAPVHVDVIGVGASVFDFLQQLNIQTEGVNNAAKSHATDKSGKLSFKNKRAELYWKFREMLDPTADNGIALPPDPKLKADLVTPRWKLTVQGIQIELKEEIVERLGRSPDDGDAVVLASIETPREAWGDAWNRPLSTPRRRV